MARSPKRAVTASGAWRVSWRMWMVTTTWERFRHSQVRSSSVGRNMVTAGLDLLGENAWGLRWSAERNFRVEFFRLIKRCTPWITAIFSLDREEEVVN